MKMDSTLHENNGKKKLEKYRQDKKTSFKKVVLGSE
jgi:hypothetical protein